MPSLNSISKRTLDVALSAIGLLVAAPFMALIAVLVWIDDSGEIIFSQPRLGRHGVPFKMHKFRKFPANWGNKGPGVTVRADARMTRIGGILERTKLDELPQLWNIFKGEMSFVGPRPESLRYQDLFAGEYAKVLQFKPGVFGPNQIAYRNEADMYPPDEPPEEYYRRVLFPAKATNDIDYFSRSTLVGDIQWIVRGLWVSLIGAIPWRRVMGFHAKIVLVDTLMIVTAWIMAYVLRFSDFQTSFSGILHLRNDVSLAVSHQVNWQELYQGLIIIPLVIIGSMLMAGCYRVPVRHFSLPDAVRLFWAVSIGWMLAYLLLIGMTSRSISFLLFPITGPLLLGLVALPRILARHMDLARPQTHASAQRRILIYGGNSAGNALARLVRVGMSGTSLVGFLDDNPELLNCTLVNSRVLGRESDLPLLKEVYDFTELWVAFSPDTIKRKRLRTTCRGLGVALYFLFDLEPFTALVPVSEKGEELSSMPNSKRDREIDVAETHGHRT